MAIGTGIGNIGRLGSGFDRYNAWKSQQFPSTPTSFSRTTTGPPSRTRATEGYGGSAAGRDPTTRLAAVRRSIDAAGKRFWGKSGVPPSTGGGGGRRSRFEQFNPTGRPYGHGNPKRLSYRRFTSKWISPPGGRGLLQPNPSYMGGSGRFDAGQASRMGMGRMPGQMRTTFPRYTSWT